MAALESALVCGSIGAALQYGRQICAPASRSRMASKTVSTMLLALLAASGGPSWLLTLALGLCAIGDGFLAWPGDACFLCGLGSFLAAHVCYTLLYCRLGDGLGSILAFWRLAGAALLASLTATSLYVLVPRVDKHMKLPIVLYAATILTMALTALSLQNRALVIIGSVCLVLSDTVLAADEFLVATDYHYRPNMQIFVWLSYYLGQLLVVSGLTMYR
ncbi:hypothetical protein CDD82_1718 [Ophiocordyceps australis]|uniref:YhhN-like protein n=1 Tax=Ophiocordyceps australis TaxID=1399860 RepID=A0A2C5XJJ3_9HYPO|nr:hypothetical protein CDD82_1718 [Ophiocordyceps australis]